MKYLYDKFVRILSVIAIHFLTFFTAYLYFKYLNENGGILCSSIAGFVLLGVFWSNDFTQVVRKGYMTGYRPLDKRYGFVVNCIFNFVDKTKLCQMIEITFV